MKNAYGRFGAMIVTAMVVMFALTYVNSYQLGHVEWSETRLYMTFVMGAAMTCVMLAFMLNMYQNRRFNSSIVIGSAITFVVALWLVRSQSTVGDKSYMRAMIPHHSIAILTSERSQIEDVRVRQLADEIMEAQRKEIQEMKWLLRDIEENGKAKSEEQAEARPVPQFSAKN